MKNILSVLLTFTFMVALCISCGDNDPGPSGPSDTFDRRAMLIDIADHMIIPAFSTYQEKVRTLKDDAISFAETPTSESLNQIRNSYIEAYKAWQTVSIYDIGKAESIDLRGYTNIYPTDVDQINNNIVSGEYNLLLPSTRDEQGYPALDYLLFGTGENDIEILSVLSSEDHVEYVTSLTQRLFSITNEVFNDWTTYREDFVNNDGSSATSSIDKLVNDYLFYYEKFLRAGKVGIPAGVFSTTPLPGNVEAPFSKIYNKELLSIGLNSAIDFFKGKQVDTDAIGEGLASYLDYLSTDKDGERLSDLINNQFSTALTELQGLNNDLALQVQEDNSQMLEMYDELQKNVVLLKVDMLQALNVKVDYVDADGD